MTLNVLILPSRIASKILRQNAGCWLWAAHRNSAGYGRVAFNGKIRQAHRVIYELLVGQIPESLQLDHLCRNKQCVNPTHLEPVTQRENAKRARPTHCKHGHEFTMSNTGFRSDGTGRYCKACEQRIKKAIRSTEQYRKERKAYLALYYEKNRDHINAGKRDYRKRTGRR